MSIYAIEEYLSRGMLTEANIIVNTLIENNCLNINNSHNSSNNKCCPDIIISITN